VASYLWGRWRVDERWGDRVPRSPPDDADGSAGPSATIRSELRGFARVEGATSLDVLAVLRQVRDLLLPLTAEHDTAIQIRFEEPAPAIRGDRVALRQALLAVLAHAVVVSGSSAIDADVRRLGGEVELLLAGRSREAVTAAQLGLDDCVPFVEALAGTVAFEVTPHRPAAWRVTLSFPTPGGLVLLAVDNDPAFVDLIRRYLSHQGWDVVGASTADEALEVARTREPAAVLLDVVLPDRDGWELLLDLRRQVATQQIPVVVCSALDEGEVARSLGAAAYLRKPVSQVDLVTTLAHLPSWRHRTAS